MKTIPAMRIFGLEEMAELFAACYESLHHSYQKTMETDLYLLSEEAYQASQYLRTEIMRRNNTQTIH